MAPWRPERPSPATRPHALLERFIAVKYSLQSPARNFFCIQCMEGPLSSSQFQDGRPHAGHPSLQVRKHTSRTHVVNVDDIADLIDVSRLQQFQTNGASAIALHARHDVVRLREPAADRRLCEQCQDSISSTVTLCSIGCSLRSNRAPEEPPIVPSPRNDHQAESSTP